MVIYIELKGDRIYQWSTSWVNGYEKIQIPDNHPMIISLNNDVYDYIDGKVVVSQNVNLIDGIKNDKINELIVQCRLAIEDGFLVDGYKYSYAQDNQINFQDTYQLFINNMISEIMWNAYVDGKKERIKLGKAEFTKVYLTGVKHKADCLSRLNDVLIPLVNKAETKEVVGRIYWDENIESPEMIIKEDKTINKQVDSLNKTTQSLQASSMTTMMALVQVSGMINNKG